MTQADDDANAAQRREIESKLAGLDRLEMTGLVTGDRYKAMRAKLLADLEALGGPVEPAARPSWQSRPPEPPAPAAAPPQPPAAALPPPAAAPPEAQPQPSWQARPPAAEAAAAPQDAPPPTTQPAAPAWQVRPAAGEAPPVPARQPAPPPPTPAWQPAVQPPPAAAPPVVAAPPVAAGLPVDSAPPAWPASPPAAVPPYQAVPGTPPMPAAPRGTRVPMLAVAGAVLVLLAGGGAAFALHGGSKPAAATVSAPTSSGAGSATPSPTPEATGFGALYLADIAPLNKAWDDFFTALDNAPSGAACGCPPGEFSFRPVLPFYETLLSTYNTTIGNLRVMQQEMPAGSAVAGATLALIEDQQTTLTALRTVFGDGSASSGNVSAVGQLNRDVDLEHATASVLRKLLGLPPAPGSSAPPAQQATPPPAAA